ncbi:hypothetical protein ABOM_008082 [Aspergillus bombycis]|uniref:Uncharacterized protein n=1 Tax=Aspergillus bombycis TaxID=109264 RepID=A0A1F7ZVQ2_9EURO|nr:hypothetical protein ABOM_008082 [Aspergillus bombycis]OGM43514.1 hypothetical protein ABOM_008082 [Aspergillus bombycis]
MANPSSLLSEARYLREGVVFEDFVQWADRVCHDPDNWKYDLRAVKMFQHIKQSHPDIKAPGLFFRAERPVLYSEWVSGEPLAVWNSQIPLNKRQRLLEDLAEFLLQLWTTAAPHPNFMPESKPQYSAWLTESLDRGLRRTLTGTARWGDAIEYLIMRSMIPEYAEPVEHAASVSVKTDEELKYILHNIPEAPFNLEGADVILIDDEEYLDELKYEDAAGYNIEIEDDLPEQDYKEADYLEKGGFISDKARYQAASIASEEDHEVL